MNVGNIYALYASGKLKSDVNRISMRMGFLKTNVRWNAREVRNVEADAEVKIEMMLKVMEQIEK